MAMPSAARFVACGVFGLGLGALSSASAAPPQPYSLDPRSEITLRYCLGPCLCPYHEFTAPVSGGFLLTFVGSDPLFDHYAVTGVQWTTLINGQTLSVAGSGTYRIGGAFGLVHELKLTLKVGIDEPQLHASGLVPVDPGHPFPEIAAALETRVFGCRQNALSLLAFPDGCYADCSGEGSLTVADFGCFQSRYVLASPYADCTADGSLSVADFGCFQNAYVAGCP